MYILPFSCFILVYFFIRYIWHVSIISSFFLVLFQKLPVFLFLCLSLVATPIAASKGMICIRQFYRDSNDITFTCIVGEPKYKRICFSRGGHFRHCSRRKQPPRQEVTFSTLPNIESPLCWPTLPYCSQYLNWLWLQLVKLSFLTAVSI